MVTTRQTIEKKKISILNHPLMEKKLLHRDLQRRFSGKYEIKEIYDRNGKETIRCLIAVVHGNYSSAKSNDEHNYKYQSGSISITFRGTDTLENVLADVQFLTVRYEAQPFNASNDSVEQETEKLTQQPQYHSTVHAGFRDAWYGDNLRTNVMKCVCDRVDELNRQNAYVASLGIEVIDSVPTIDIAGHSLGGSLAVLAAYDLAKTLSIGERANIRVYTHGCPRVGNGTFAQQFNDNVAPCWNIINDNDIVPAIPHSPSRPVLQKLCACLPASKKLKSIGYQRHGRAVILKSNGNFIVDPTRRQKYRREAKVLRLPKAIKSHETGEYRAHILAAIQCQIKAASPSGVSVLEKLNYSVGLLGRLEKVIVESRADPTRSFRVLPGAT